MLSKIIESGKKYDIIYADPPWAYQDSKSTDTRSASGHYEVIKSKKLHKLNVSKIASDNCLLFMWVTMPKLNEAFDVIKAWGFEYKTNAFTWIKTNKKSDSLFMGMGRWTRANAELCLLATKGKPQRVSASVHSVIQARLGQHSEKPAIVRDKIIELCGDLPRIELFSRHVIDGWDRVGNEIL